MCKMKSVGDSPRPAHDEGAVAAMALFRKFPDRFVFHCGHTAPAEWFTEQADTSATSATPRDTPAEATQGLPSTPVSGEPPAPPDAAEASTEGHPLHTPSTPDVATFLARR